MPDLVGRLNSVYKDLLSNGRTSLVRTSDHNSWGVRNYYKVIDTETDRLLMTYWSLFRNSLVLSSCCGVSQIQFDLDYNIMHLKRHKLFPEVVARVIDFQCHEDDRVYITGLPVKRASGKNWAYYTRICKLLESFGATSLTDKNYKNGNSGNYLKVLAFRRPNEPLSAL